MRKPLNTTLYSCELYVKNLIFRSNFQFLAVASFISSFIQMCTLFWFVKALIKHRNSYFIMLFIILKRFMTQTWNGFILFQWQCFHWLSWPTLSLGGHADEAQHWSPEGQLLINATDNVRAQLCWESAGNSAHQPHVLLSFLFSRLGEEGQGGFAGWVAETSHEQPAPERGIADG